MPHQDAAPGHPGQSVRDRVGHRRRAVPGCGARTARPRGERRTCGLLPRHRARLPTPAAGRTQVVPEPPLPRLAPKRGSFCSCSASACRLSHRPSST